MERSSKALSRRRRLAACGLFGVALLAAGLARAGSRAAADASPAAPADGVVLVHFWATWCAPCTEELPGLAAFYRGPYQALAERGLRLVTVSQDVREEDLARYLAEHRPPFPVVLDSLGEISQRLALRGVPATVLVDSGGVVLDRMLGPQEWSSPALHDRLRAFLPQRGGT